MSCSLTGALSSRFLIRALHDEGIQKEKRTTSAELLRVFVRQNSITCATEESVEPVEPAESVESVETMYTGKISTS
jgi:hypothetical protein